MQIFGSQGNDHYQLLLMTTNGIVLFQSFQEIYNLKDWINNENNHNHNIYIINSMNMELPYQI